MQSLSAIRRTFIDYFVRNGHTHVPSSPLVPQNDPTLMFTAAGMVQFKDLFTSAETRPYTRAVTSQKCLRAGGKHNDLDNVGYTARHHTFFEMLGNFSFGDYFKEDAIRFAYEMVTKEFCLDPKRLLVTVYSDDEEAAALWRKIGGFSDDKIIRISTSDNFWSMGDTGPCGPCSEIFFDHGDKIQGGPPGSADEDGDRFIEVWNLVFMQYEQLANGTRVNLPKPSIDTGMGLERIASVLQGQHNNFDTDLFKQLIDASQELTKNARADMRQSHNVIADHLRASAFLIADGVMPSNEGRGYVLRRILRRGMRHAHILGAKEPLMWQLVGTLIQAMGETFPELCRAKSLIEQTLHLEEERFHQTLDRGLKVLKDATQTLTPNAPLPGDVAFKLYDTYGFPLDLTEDVLRSENRSVDRDGFADHMTEQKKRARAAWAGSGDAANEQVWLDVREEHGATDFLGYSTTHAEGVVVAIVKDGHVVEKANEGDAVSVVLNQTPFYAESGGQVGDSGLIEGNGFTLEVTDCVKKVGVLFVHEARVTKGTVQKGAAIRAHIDEQRRRLIASNHSATHLLHAALRRVLGDHVSQKGSHVDDKRLRFDFTHAKGMTADELRQVEDLVNQEVRRNTQANVVISTPDKAIAAGAMALFGERYGDEVRVVSFGGEGSQCEKTQGAYFSVELCGGTHVNATGDIGLFKIMSEGSVASGVRRVEAITGPAVLDHIRNLEESVESLTQQNRKLAIDSQKQVEALQTRLVLQRCENAHEKTIPFGPYRSVFLQLSDVSAKDLKALAETVRQKLGSGIVVATSVVDSKVALVIAVTDDLTAKINAVDLVRVAASHLGGKGGGGKPDCAQAGGELVANVATLHEALIKSVS